MNREYHEAVQFLEPEISQQIRKGNEYLKKIPFPEIVIEEENEENICGLSKKDFEEYGSKLNFNFPNENIKFMEKILIQEQNYLGLMELLKNQYPYNKLLPFILYSYCRELCGLPIKKSENDKIKRDLKAIKKGCDHLTKKQLKKEERKIKIEF